MALGRALQPNLLMPAATAPDDTSTSSTPCSRSATICLTQTAIAARSRPRPSALRTGYLVTHDLPTLAATCDYKNAAIKRRFCSCLIPDVNDFRAIIFVFFIPEAVVFIDFTDRLDPGTTQRTLVVQRLQLSARLVLDARIQLGQLGGVLWVFLNALGARLKEVHDVITELLSALARQGRNYINRPSPLDPRDDFSNPRFLLFIEHLVSLVQHQPALTLSQRRTELGQLINNGGGRLSWIGQIQRRHINEMQQQTGTRQMLEEADTQTSTVRSTLDQPRNVCNHEVFVAIDTDHAQVRHQRGEGIVSDFRLGGRHGANEGALAGIRQAQQAYIGQHLQFQLEIARLARLARRGLPRSTVGTGLEAGVTQTMPATLRHHQTLTSANQVTNHLLSTGIDHR